MAEALLTAESVSRVFTTGAGDVRALTDVSMEVTAGELVVVRGPSGSGKTTLLNLLGGLDRPTGGRVLLGDGRELSSLPEKDVLEVRRTRIGYVFQSFGLIPVLSAAENVEVPLRLLEVDPAEREERVAAALELVGLADHVHQRPYELSGGQQQRVGIARALVAEPEVLLADEPTGQLDSRTAATIMELLQELTRARGLAAVVSTHDPVLIQRADSVLTLKDGHPAA
ncbi:putative ABC transport system ATP-binding protein [Georgenia satyanarayanai]|uniref:Putative ABC transport system ATP-binding protein n=1 Tax=Georgenia satyanarayanai TaxID=860221 RepID=A0A2Y9APV1_9MICO|nr:ABC transporter ATP-binding protein [Georgenia satyanarayanai]PYF96814.1 putative ABC transport system ATP-binding protein [Georgenia satyanarayanai]SSA46410.1 putative ABC transport system ATP-binding protein [Georgenia satyanarayanai]